MNMKNNIHSIIFLTLAAFVVIFSVSSCEDDTVYDGLPITNDLRVLQVQYNGSAVTGSIANFDPVGQFQLIFSHTLDVSSFESAMSITPAAVYSLTYDSTNSYVTISFTEPLQYETDYTLSLPAGTYGSSGESMTGDYQLIISTKAFVPPVISLSVDASEFYEGDEITVNANITESILKDVTFDITLSGTATKDADYSIDNTSLTIAAGNTTASAKITVLPDGDTEGVETLILELDNLVNCVESVDQTLTINLNDVPPAIELKGVMELDNYIGGSDGRVRAIHLRVLENIPDLSIYGVEIASNGAAPKPNDIDFMFPPGTASKGDEIFVVRDQDFANAQAYFETCFNSFTVFQSSRITQNGDDAILLYKDKVAIESFGQPGTDGTGEAWEYTDSWAYKLGDEWIYPGPNAAESSGNETVSNAVAKYPFCNPLELKGVTAMLFDVSATTSGNRGKSHHLRINRDIPDLSIYGMGVANNGGGTDGQEFTFPAISVKEGEQILIARYPDAMAEYYGTTCYSKFTYVYVDSYCSQNGDDAIEVFKDGSVIETYGDANVDGTGQGWEYTGSWAFKGDNGKWSNGGLSCTSGATSNSASSCPYPFCN